MGNAFQRLEKRADAAKAPAVNVPKVGSLEEYLSTYAVAKGRRGDYVPYSFEGRPALLVITRMIDEILGSHTGQMIRGARVRIGGGAQWGKTVWLLNTKTYFLGIKFMNFGYYLPDDDLVEGIIDTKFRPDVVDQQPWFADMLTIGKAVSKSGKQVNKKGSIMVTDGQRSSQGYCRGMGKIPTTFSMDCYATDERDDIKDKNAKYLTGRMTNSDLQLGMDIGTMRYDGAGQNKEYKKGSQHICIIRCSDCASDINPEENWPQVCRVQLGGKPSASDPKLNRAGVFVHPGSDEAVCDYEPDGIYYLACPHCGADLKRDEVTEDNWIPQRPERLKFHDYSVRVSQLGAPAIDMIQIVQDWCENAVKDPESMNMFNCDRLALPKSSDQTIDESIIQRSRDLEPFSLSLSPRAGCSRFAGMDTGNKLWFNVLESESELVNRIPWAEVISPESARTRVPLLMSLLDIKCLFIDAGPERELARSLALDLNGLRVQNVSIDSDSDFIRFASGLVWDGPNKRWRGLRCATVEFTQKPGAGIKHKLGQTMDGLYYPIIAVNRDEAIQDVVNMFLTPDEGMHHVVGGKVRMAPAIRLPQKPPGCNPIIEKLDSHIKVGSRKVYANNGKDKTFVDKCENHLLLAGTYAKLAATIVGGGANNRSAAPMPRSIKAQRNTRFNRKSRGLIG